MTYFQYELCREVVLGEEVVLSEGNHLCGLAVY